MTENEIATKIIGVCINIHKNLGPGLLESVYEDVVAYDLKEIGFDIKKQLPISLIYKKIKFEAGFRLDLLVNDKVIIELKSVSKLLPVHYAQTLTYLKLSDKKLGLLINFNVKFLKNGIHRIVNNL
ncbi:MAG: GxxExxY protein [Candidatus Cloacimonadota bacterium]|nr:GxxExxY protein [Candidatus Cloacimonadota bacterium]